MDTHANDGSASTVNYVLANGLNTPRAITDESGQTIWTWSLVGNPFGEQQPVSSTGYVYNLRFPGQYFDQETGWNYNVNRYFDPAIGGFTQVDPMGFAGGQTGLYPYGNNNPLSNTDPTGLQIAGTINNDNVDWSARAADNINLFGYLLTGTNIDQYTPGDGPIQSVSTPFEFMAAGGMARGAGAIRGMCTRTTTLFRAVSHAEFADVTESGIFRPGSNSYATGKFFAESAEDAKRWGNAMEGLNNFRILQTKFPSSTADQFMRWERLDGIGPARFGTFDQLGQPIIKPWPGSP